jgi:hypothetical protein
MSRKRLILVEFILEQVVLEEQLLALSLELINNPMT